MSDAAPFPTRANAQEVDRKETTLLILSVPCKKTHVTHQTPDASRANAARTRPSCHDANEKTTSGCLRVRAVGRAWSFFSHSETPCPGRAFGARHLRLFRTRDAAPHVQAHESSLRVARLVRHPRSHRCVSSRTKTLTRKTRFASASGLRTRWRARLRRRTRDRSALERPD